MKSKLGMTTVSGLCLCLLLRYQVGDFLLTHFGTKAMAVLTRELRQEVYVKPTLVYHFEVGDKLYEGSSIIANQTRIGDTVCIVYLPVMPSVNRQAVFLNLPCP